MCLSCRFIYLLNDFIIDLALKYHDLPFGISLLISLLLGDVPIIGAALSFLSIIALTYILFRTLHAMTNISVYDDPASWGTTFELLARLMVVLSIIGIFLAPLMTISPWTPLAFFLTFGIFLLTGQSAPLISLASEEVLVTLLRKLLYRR